MKTYVIILSNGYPFEAAHKRHEKIHTVRDNYELWNRRFHNIYNGDACLSVRVWDGKPYRSQQREIARLTINDRISIQRLDITGNDYYIDGDLLSDNDIKILAINDGLTLDDLRKWIKDKKRMAIIHFTEFRYANL